MKITAVNGLEVILGQKLALAVTWHNGRVLQLSSGWRDRLPPACGLRPVQPVQPVQIVQTRQGKKIGKELARFEAGQPPDWPALPFAWEAFAQSDFQLRVLRTLHEQVGYGDLVTYGALAALAGFPRAARAVGSVMAKSPWSLLLPCHRVLAAGGHLGGFAGDVPLKAYLLRCEGHRLSGEGSRSRVFID